MSNAHSRYFNQSGVNECFTTGKNLANNATASWASVTFGGGLWLTGGRCLPDCGLLQFAPYKESICCEFIANGEIYVQEAIALWTAGYSIVESLMEIT